LRSTLQEAVVGAEQQHCVVPVMVVVIGSPAGRLGGHGVRASGLAVDAARAAVQSGGAVQVVGRVGDDAVGDAVLLDMAAAGIGHVAVLRAAGQPTSVQPEPATDDAAPGAALDDEKAEADDGRAADGENELAVDAGDLELALRYLPDYRVLVVATELDPPAWATVIAATSWSGAHLIGLVRAGGAPADVPEDATILERPAADADGTFAAMVGRYAAGLDSGEEPAAAFAAASNGSGWASVAD
jgi:hypothetical protein